MVLEQADESRADLVELGAEPAQEHRPCEDLSRGMSAPDLRSLGVLTVVSMSLRLEKSRLESNSVADLNLLCNKGYQSGNVQPRAV